MKLDLVNVKHGTESAHRFSRGNTLPLTALPHSFAAFAPQTEVGRGSWWYHPKDRSFEGVRLTHQPSPWIGDFSYFTFMPQSGKPYVSADSRWSGFIPEKTELHPHYMKVRLLRYGVEMSLAPTDTGCVISLDFDDYVTEPRFAVTPSDCYGEIKVDLKNREICGFTTSKNATVKREWRTYFIFKFDCDLIGAEVTDGENAKSGTEFKGNSAGASVVLASGRCTVRMATSYLSLEQARLNMSRDPETFDEAKQFAQDQWEDVLGKIEVEGEIEKRKTFYSCLYRAFLYPTKFYEVDKDGNPTYVVAQTGEVKNGIMYTNNGFWDTYRTVYPLYSLIAPEKCRDFNKAWLNYYKDTGYLPRWVSSTDIECMPGTLVEAVLADGVVKGILEEDDALLALEAVLKNAEVQSENSGQGRKCVEFYKINGYVPYDECWESVNETLDCAYGDFCISQIARKLGKKETAEKYLSRSKNYKKLFDENIGLMRAKDGKGEFRPNFDKYAWGRDYTEGCSYQTSIAVQQDVDGLVELYGGKERFEKFLDEATAREYPRYTIGGYGGEIHEMTEMNTVPFGQCAISNQPSFHMPYLYHAVERYDKTDMLVAELVDLFSNKDDGYPGDEDNGTTASWYIFATLGLYPLTPGKDEYVVTKSHFDKAVIKVRGRDVDLNQKLKGKHIIKHDEI